MSIRYVTNPWELRAGVSLMKACVMKTGFFVNTIPILYGAGREIDKLGRIVVSVSLGVRWLIGTGAFRGASVKTAMYALRSHN